MNGIPIKPWIYNPNDTELQFMQKFLTYINNYEDVRVPISSFIEYDEINKEKFTMFLCKEYVL